MNEYPSSSSRSAQLFERAKRVMPGGSTRQNVTFEPYPIYASHGSGFTITDVDGVERIDFINNYSALIHGHSHPKIVRALQQQAEKVMAVAAPTESEIALAELIVARLPSVDRLRFCNSGTEAVMFAVQAARTYSGRPKVARVEGAYHGGYDFDTVMLPLDDVEQSRRLLDAHKDVLAGVIFDPIVGRLGFAEASPAYIRFLSEWTRANDRLLLLDEVFSLRIDYRGVQGRYGIEPDLTALGKIIGGGVPIGAVGGRADVMAVFNDGHGHARLPHNGTYNGNPLAMVAGRASMELLTAEEIARINALGDRLRGGIARVLAEGNVDARAQGVGSMVAIAPINTPLNFELFKAMLNEGILMMPRGAFVISTPMREAQIDRAIEALAASLRTLAVRS